MTVLIRALQIEKVTVNIANAASGYIETVMSYPNTRRYRSKDTVCFGPCRMSIVPNEDHQGSFKLVSMRLNLSDINGGFCLKPIIHDNFFPTSGNVFNISPSHDLIVNLVGNVVGNMNANLLSYEIADAMFASSLHSQMIILYGPTHTGKTELLKFICGLFGIYGVTIDGHMFARSLKDKSIFRMGSVYRVTCVDELDISSVEHLGTLKTLLGGATVTLPGEVFSNSWDL
jgi:hypothetical protein